MILEPLGSIVGGADMGEVKREVVLVIALLVVCSMHISGAGLGGDN